MNSLALSLLAVVFALGNGAVAAEPVRWAPKPDFAGEAKVEMLGAPVVAEVLGAKAWVFEGVDDGLMIAALPAEGAKAFTVEMRIAPATGGNEEQRFFHMEDAAGRRALLELRLDKDGHWALDTFMRHGEARLTLLDRTIRHPAGAWHWVALRYDGRRMTSFVNGKKELEGDVVITPFEAGKTSLGVRQNRVSWFKGAIAEVRVHPRALEADELAR